MRKFRINVNGKSYEVEVEEIRDGAVVDTRPTPAPATAVPRQLHLLRQHPRHLHLLQQPLQPKPHQ